MRRIKDFIDFIDEAISLDHARKATKIFLDSGGKQRYDDIFKGSDRLYYDFDQKSITKTPIELEVIQALGKNGYYLADYEKGLAKKEGDDKNIFKVQKILTKFGFSDLKNKVDADPLRASSRKDQKKIVISRHGIDIAGQSTGRTWTSCKTLKDSSGINSHFIWSEIEKGGLVAYLIEADDLNIENPIARIMIGVFINSEDNSDFILYPDTNTYGNYNKKDFLTFVEDWCDDANSKLSKNYKGLYTISPSCYVDVRRHLNVLRGEETKLDYLHTLMDPHKTTFTRIRDFSISPDEMKGLIRFAGDNLTKYEPSHFFNTILKHISDDNFMDYINSNSIENIKSDIEKLPKVFNAYLKSVNKLDSIDKEKAHKIKEQIAIAISEDGTVESGMEKFRYTLDNLALEPDSMRVIRWILKD